MTLAGDDRQLSPSWRSVLPVIWQRQLQQDWCGPATARMVLSTRLGAGTPSQSTLGAMVGAQGTFRTAMRDALNTACGDRTYRVYGDLDRPLTPEQRETFCRRVRVSIAANSAVAVGVLVRPGEARPLGYPDRTVDHWVAVHGYAADVGEGTGGEPAVCVSDPAAGLPEFAAVPRRYWLPVALLAEFIKVYVA